MERSNSVTIAIEKLRQFQQMLFDRTVSPQDLFNQTNKIIEVMHDAEKEINTNYDKISQQLTKAMNEGTLGKK